jgi:hypothetical protein
MGGHGHARRRRVPRCCGRGARARQARRAARRDAPTQPGRRPRGRRWRRRVDQAPAHAPQQKLGRSSPGISAGDRQMVRSDPFVEREQESQPRSDQELIAPEEAEMARITRLERDPIAHRYGKRHRADGLDVQTLDVSKTLAKEELKRRLDRWGESGRDQGACRAHTRDCPPNRGGQQHPEALDRLAVRSPGPGPTQLSRNSAEARLASRQAAGRPCATTATRRKRT